MQQAAQRVEKTKRADRQEEQESQNEESFGLGLGTAGEPIGNVAQRQKSQSRWR
jgi:hypothetical protein